MCGICGLYHPEAGALGGREATASIRAMTQLLTSRGPDDEAFWADPAGRVQLGFRRLAIVDLSLGGRQPRISASGQSVLVFNGEIYNFRELRAELAASNRPCATQSDSEVLIEALEAWGLAALPKLRGMFALAWYEIAACRLTLARDPFGIKPLYWATGPAGALAFGSQYNLFWQNPWPVPDQVDPEHLSLYLQLAHLPAPAALMRGTHQLAPASYLQADAAGYRLGHYLEPVSASPAPGDRLEQLSSLLEVALERHRVADVPLGLFLSGGIDSPLVGALARRQALADTGQRLPAFTLANPGWGQDESAQARRYAAALDLDHHVLELGENDALAAIDTLMVAQHEPFADYSALPTLVLSRFAHEAGIKVALSGDGGDELFFGYERPLSLIRDHRPLGWSPWARRGYWWLRRAGRVFGGRRASDALLFPSPGAFYRAVASRMDRADLRRLAPDLPADPTAFELYQQGTTDDVDELLRFAQRAEMGGQLQRGLKKVDLASMACGLEVRVPLLDLDLANWAMQLPPTGHLAGGIRKALLGRALQREIPHEPLPSAKLGFGVPLARWLRDPRGKLASQIAARLFDGPLFPAGLFARPAVEAYWQEHQRGQANHQWGIWALFTLQEWAHRHRQRHWP